MGKVLQAELLSERNDSMQYLNIDFHFYFKNFGWCWDLTIQFYGDNVAKYLV